MQVTLVTLGMIITEVGFWVLLAAALLSRYLLSKKRLSILLLLGVPVLEVLLLALITWDLTIHQATANLWHGMGAVYLGFTVGFARQIINTSDAWFAHRFADGPALVKPDKNTLEHVRYEWRQWTRMLIAAVVTTLIIALMVLITGDSSRTNALIEWIGRVWFLTVIWLLGWPIWVSVAHLIGRTRN